MHRWATMAAVGFVLWSTPVRATLDRHAVEGQGLGTPVRYAYQGYYRKQRDYRQAHKQRVAKRLAARNGKQLKRARPAHRMLGQGIAARIVAHPEGCPRRQFCGCGVSLKVFGKRVRHLYLASNWLQFKPVAARPGAVAARPGHVFYIIRPLGAGRVLAYDPNSGRNLTRIHVRSLAGYRVVDPRG